MQFYDQLIMDTSQITSTLQHFLDSHPEIQCAYLFGSATGERFSNHSDIDLGIAANDCLTAEEKAHLCTELESLFQRDIDLVDLHQATGGILRQALHGVCVLCRDSWVRYRLLRRLIYDQEDMQPIRRLTMQLRRQRFAYGY